MLADGASTDTGELALGQNMLIAFMPWNGYNYEDPVLISDAWLPTIATPRSTSRSSPSSPATRSSALRKSRATSRTCPKTSCPVSDDSGIVFIGAEVKAGDVACRKVTPKGETQLTPEEKPPARDLR